MKQKRRTIFSQKSTPDEVDGNALSLYPVKLYMDESGNGNQRDPLLVGGIVADIESESLESEVEQLYENLAARRYLRGYESFEKFREHGFHASSDSVEISVPFFRLIQESVAFKAYVYITDRSGLSPLSEVEQIKELYAALVSDNLIRYRREEEVFCYIEENSSLREFARQLPLIAPRKAVEKLGRKVSLPTLRVEMVKKREKILVSIIDYIMMAISRWARDQYLRDITKRGYRNFREVESTISLLYSVEHGVLLNRNSGAN
ncbi:hypothetical protein OOZ19_24920 [Saccharopolyspora sp. NFXS83]|uniref:hypothetical protein n=1 Tax=Saccharopolyspora sp. NFXS83 TaxID=2993560 RepID=UPI00224A829A|nr:hypothetical protein [Saccharopolyspora sp. NFXS83]MCX2733499.1 hypothetical protein [Saccharopolyspora sp. NFXS83]